MSTTKDKKLKFWQFWLFFGVPGAPKWVPRTKNITQIIPCIANEYILKIWSHYDQRQNFWNFDNLDQFRKSLGPPNRSLHQNILHRYFHIENMNKLWIFEAFTTSSSPKMGPQIKILVQQFFGHGKMSTIWAFEISSPKTEGEVLFPSVGPFRALLGQRPKTGPQIKILVQQFLNMVRWLYSEDMGILAQNCRRSSIFKFWAILGTFWAIDPKRGLKSKLCSMNFWALDKSVIP